MLAGLPRNERADSLAKTRATLPVTHVPCPLALTIAKIRHTSYSLWKRNFLTTPSSARFLRFPQRNWPFPVLSAVNVLTSLSRSQPSFVLLPMQHKTKGEFFMQCLQTPSARPDLSPPWLSRIQASLARHLRLSLHFWPLVQTLGRGPTIWVSVEFFHALIPRKGSGSTITTTTRL